VQNSGIKKKRLGIVCPAFKEEEKRKEKP